MCQYSNNCLFGTDGCFVCNKCRLSELISVSFYRNCGHYLVNINIVFILKSLYSQYPIFNSAQDTCSWKLF